MPFSWIRFFSADATSALRLRAAPLMPVVRMEMSIFPVEGSTAACFSASLYNLHKEVTERLSLGKFLPVKVVMYFQAANICCAVLIKLVVTIFQWQSTLGCNFNFLPSHLALMIYMFDWMFKTTIFHMTLPISVVYRNGLRLQIDNRLHHVSDPCKWSLSIVSQV